MSDGEVDEESVHIAKKKRMSRKLGEDPPKTPEKKKGKGRPRKFIDDECGEEKEKKSSPKKSPTKSPTKGLTVAEKKLMASARKEVDNLLKLLCDRDDPTHYEWPDRSIRKQFAEVIKWAWLSELDGPVETEEHPGFIEFWRWWSHPMESTNNKIWEQYCEGSQALPENKAIIASKVEDLKEKWVEDFEEALPAKASLARIRSWVAYEAKKRKILLNPMTRDADIAYIAETYLHDQFVLLDENGASAKWEEGPKLWIIRKQKERSAVALGEALQSLIGNQIRFTDEKLEAKFEAYINSAGSTVHAINWLKGKIPVFPAPLKEKLDADKWSIAIQEGKLADFKTLKIRSRTNLDLFSNAASFKWLVNHEDHDGVIVMDSKLLIEYKEAVKNHDYENVFKLLQQLCPNAFKFTQGPFRERTRHMFMLQHMGLWLTTHCTRKGMWLFGNGRGMKSTLLASIVKCMGPFATTLSKKVFFNSGTETSHNTDLMRAEGKRLVYVDELEKRDQLKETVYKLFTAHQKMSCREIFGFQVEWPPLGTPVFLMNTVPPMQFTDASVPDRILPVRATTRVFNRTGDLNELPPSFVSAETWEDHFDEGAQLFYVMKRQEAVLWAEKFMLPEDDGGYMNELGCLLVLCAHLAYTEVSLSETGGEIVEPDIIKQDYKDFLSETDHISQFIADCTYPADSPTTLIKSAYEDYKAWCLEGLLKPSEKRQFQAALQTKGLIGQIRKIFVTKKGKEQMGGKQLGVRVHLRSNMDHLMGDDDEIAAIVDDTIAKAKNKK